MAAEPAARAAAKPTGNGASERLASRARKPANGEYVVRRGDTLRSIADKALGDADAWEQILRANPDVDFDPDRIPPGTRLKVR
jgi:nucleoid-associated protein YgaU